VPKGAENVNVRRCSIGILAVVLSVGPAVLTFPSGAGAGTNPVGYAGSARDVTRTRAIHNTSQQFTSRNWDGYITYASSHGTDFNSVKATWVQPSVTCEAAGAWTVFWVGLDGWWNNTVEQGGSEAQCGTGGAATYSLWWEMFPTNAIQTVLTIKVGDKITASVKYSTTTSKFTITVKDVTSGKSFTNRELCGSGLVCSRSSADVITEDVGMFGGSGFFPLADYGTMGYTTAGATDIAGHKGSISGKNWLNAAVSEITGGITYATVTPLSARGTAFSTVWKHQ
jgi:Peptidase A4 family